MVIVSSNAKERERWQDARGSHPSWTGRADCCCSCDRHVASGAAASVIGERDRVARLPGSMNRPSGVWLIVSSWVCLHSVIGSGCEG